MSWNSGKIDLLNLARRGTWAVAGWWECAGIRVNWCSYLSGIGVMSDVGYCWGIGGWMLKGAVLM